MKGVDSVRRLLPISNSTLYGSGCLDHAEREIRELVGDTGRIVSVPFAVHDRRAYAAKADEGFRQMGLSLRSIHDVSNMQRAIDEADAIFVGGGNTFRLLKGLYDDHLLAAIRDRAAAGMPTSDRARVPSWHVPR